MSRTECGTDTVGRNTQKFDHTTANKRFSEPSTGRKTRLVRRQVRRREKMNTLENDTNEKNGVNAQDGWRSRDGRLNLEDLSSHDDCVIAAHRSYLLH